jgi:hypothetical protein
MSDFLEAVMDTRPMRYCQALLVAMVRDWGGTTVILSRWRLLTH